MEQWQRRRVVGTSTARVDPWTRDAVRPLRRNARARRSRALIDAIHRVDAALDPAAREELARFAREQYETQVGDVPLGFFAQCHLGPPYVDHRLDLVHSIVEHYTLADTPPDPFAAARMLVRTDAYAYVEVYASGELRPVYPDGSVAA